MADAATVASIRARAKNLQQQYGLSEDEALCLAAMERGFETFDEAVLSRCIEKQSAT